MTDKTLEQRIGPAPAKATKAELRILLGWAYERCENLYNTRSTLLSQYHTRGMERDKANAEIARLKQLLAYVASN